MSFQQKQSGRQNHALIGSKKKKAIDERLSQLKQRMIQSGQIKHDLRPPQNESNQEKAPEIKKRYTREFVRSNVIFQNAF